MMGMTKNMKGKFSLAGLRTKSNSALNQTSAGYALDGQAHADTHILSGGRDDDDDEYNTDSPPYSPTASEMERPQIPAQIHKDLRHACAVLVEMTNPPDPDDEDDLLDPKEIIRRAEAERKARYLAKIQEMEAKSMKPEVRPLRHADVPRSEPQVSVADHPSRLATRRPLHSDTDRADEQPPSSHTRLEALAGPTAKVPTTHYIPKDPQSRARRRDEIEKQSLLEANNRNAGAHAEHVLPPVHAPIIERSRYAPRDDAQALGQIRSSLHMRPKTSAAACVDYDNSDPTSLSSNSTSRTTSDYLALHGRPPSTGLTSVQALTPNCDLSGRSMSQQGVRRPSEGGSATSSMQEEIQELARRRADEYTAKKSGQQPPPSRQSKLSRMTSNSDLNAAARPPSRAGSLASSIAGGISNYIRPRTSSSNYDGGRSGRSSSLGTSRPDSRSSSRSRRSSFSGAGGWWKNGGLRRRGSWASFRSGGSPLVGSKEQRKALKDGEPNLNRPLPALPGLDQYRETKTHIGQLVARTTKRKVRKHKISEPQPLLPVDTPYTATLPASISRSQSTEPYQAASAPLPNSEGQERHFFPPTPDLGHAAEQRGREHVERRSTHPVEVQYTKKSSSSRQRQQQQHQEQSQQQYQQQQQQSRGQPQGIQFSQSHQASPYIYGSSTFAQAMQEPHLSPKTVLPSPKIAQSANGSSGPTKKSSNSKLRRSSLNPLKPRRPSVTSSSKETSSSNGNSTATTTTKLPPPMIRGPSYKRELEAGVYPRRMDVNDGAVAKVVLTTSPAQAVHHTNAAAMATNAHQAAGAIQDAGLGMSMMNRHRPQIVHRDDSANGGATAMAQGMTALPQAAEWGNVASESRSGKQEKSNKTKKPSSGDIHGHGAGGGVPSRGRIGVVAN